MRQIKAAFLLPLSDADRRELTAQVRAVEDELLARFGRWMCYGRAERIHRTQDGRAAVVTGNLYAVVSDADHTLGLEQVLRKFRVETKYDSIHLELTPNVTTHLVK